ncbi:MAG: c-type cytochrome [Chitinophagaceae bacterium]|nr:c-type cytochrome [Chitinophagaceae bacterium]
MKKIVKVTLIILAVIVGGLICVVAFIKTALPNVGKPMDLKVQVTPGRVQRGEYLARHVAVCMDCHSQRDWSLYAGPLKKETYGCGGERFGKEIGFPGTVYSRNITPAALSSWTDGEIFRAITAGVGKDGKALFPLMPYPNYGMTDAEDIMCIIAYLRTLPAIRNDVPAQELNFPLNIIVNTMPSKAALVKKPDSNNITAYGKYLTTMAGCMECHSKVDKGTRVPGTEFGGGRSFNFPNGTVVTAPNITFDKATGIGNWDRSLFIKKFKQYGDSGYVSRAVGPSEFNTPMPWLMYAGMTDSDLAAIYTYLGTVKPIGNQVKVFQRQ